MPGWAWLGEGFWKLILAAIPQGAHVPVEVRIRIEMWQARKFEDLLRRMEMQVARARRGRGQRRKRNADEEDPDEAERSPERTQSILKMVAEGAYRKATMAIIAEDSIVSGKECKTWAEALHPRSQHGAGALATRSPHS